MNLRSAAAVGMSWISLIIAAPLRAQPVGPDPSADEARAASDAAITERVQHQLAAAAPAADHLEVSTRNGIVTLAGRVDSERMRQRVVGLAIATDGVIAINDQLVLVPHPARRPAGAAGQ